MNKAKVKVIFDGFYLKSSKQNELTFPLQNYRAYQLKTN